MTGQALSIPSRGRLTEVADTSGYTYCYYDKRCRIGLQTIFITGLSAAKKLRYRYYASDALKRITYPDGRFTDCSYNQAGQISGISRVFDKDSIQYEPWGAVKSIRYKNTLNAHRMANTYDEMGRLKQTLTWRSGQRIITRGYQYDNGFLQKEFDLDTLMTAGQYDTTAVGTVRNFTYDYRGRLTQAIMKDPLQVAPSRTVGYRCDLANNLTYRRVADVDSLVYHCYAATNCDSAAVYSDGSTLVFTKDIRGRITLERKYNVPQVSDTSAWYRLTRYGYDHRNLLTTVVFQLKNPTQSGDAPDTVMNYYDHAGRKVKQVYHYQVWVDTTGPGQLDGEPDGGELDGSEGLDGLGAHRLLANPRSGALLPLVGHSSGLRDGEWHEPLGH